MKPTLLLIGANGQLGLTFRQHWQEGGLAGKYDLKALNRSDLDLADTDTITACLNELSPDLILNTAAYTAVDLAETEKDQAFKINERAVEVIGQWCAKSGSIILHVSTDFVFDGATDSPYTPDDETSPLGNYGASKLAGEQRLQEALPERYAIVRTSWLYSEYGNNFVKTMLRLMSEKEELAVVGDQIGSPTSTHSLVKFIFGWIENGCPTGVFHWNDGSAISWFEFARAIQHSGIKSGLLESEIPVRSIKTEEYPTPARRPAYSVMDRSNAEPFLSTAPQTWQAELDQVIDALASQQN